MVNEKKHETINMDYWQYLWEDLIIYFGMGFYGLDLLNPHLIIRYIINEIDFNKLKNSQNKIFFRDQIKFFLKNDLVIKKKCKSDFVSLSIGLDTKTNIYIYQLCHEILKYFHKGLYFKESIKILVETLIKKDWTDEDKSVIKYLNQCLILEFLIKGYSLEEIQKFPRYILDNYSIRGALLITDFPHGIESKQFYNGEHFNRESYNNEIKKVMNSLSIKDRLIALQRYFFKTTKKCYFIFQVQGLKGDVDFFISEVNFYNPNKKKYIAEKNTSSSKSNDELFGGNVDKFFLNAAVNVEYLDLKSSKSNAIQKIERALNLISLYLDPHTDLKIFEDRYLIADEKRNKFGWGQSISKDNLEYKNFKSLNINEDLLINTINPILRSKNGKFFISLSNKKREIEKKIIDSIHWNRKASESNRVEDKLINYWISIENFLDFGNSKKFDNAINFIPAVNILNFIYSLGWDLYYTIRNLIPFESEFDKNLVKKCNLDPKPFSRVKLEPFIKNLDLLLDQIETEGLKSKIFFTNQFYNDNDFSKKMILEQIQKIKNDILLIYIFRNQIVHNAHFDNRILPYYVQKAKLYSSVFLRGIIKDYIYNQNDNVEQILTNSSLKVDRIITRLKGGEKIDFFKIKI